MAIVIIAQGGTLKITKDSLDPMYPNQGDLDIEVLGEKVLVTQTSQGKKLLDDDFGDFSSPSGGDAETVADAIALLIAVNGGSGTTTVSIEGANDSAKNTISASGTSVELFAANASRNHVVIRNGTDQLADVRLGDTDAVSVEEAIEVVAGKTVTITQWDGAIQIIFASTGTGTLVAEQTFIT